MKSFYKTFRTRMKLCKFFSRRICSLYLKITMHCYSFNALYQLLHLSSVTSQSLPGEVCQLYRFQDVYSVGFFSMSSAISIFFKRFLPLVREIFPCKVYRFQKISETSNAQENTPKMLCTLKPRICDEYYSTIVLR